MFLSPPHCRTNGQVGVSCCWSNPPRYPPATQVLDIPRTLEYLETQGVTVAAYGADELPAFFTRHSGCRAPCRVNTPRE